MSKQPSLQNIRRAFKVDRVATRTGCTPAQARKELVALGWNTAYAIDSLKQRAAQQVAA